MNSGHGIQGIRLYPTTFSNPFPNGDQGWTAVVTVLVRLSTEYTPSGRFPVSAIRPGPIGEKIRVGCDAAVCLQQYEPWVIEVYNTSVGSPSALRIVAKGNSSASLTSGNTREAPIAGTGYLNTTGKDRAFTAAYNNSINQIVKDDARGQFYPSPTVGPGMSLRTILLTLTNPTVRLFHRRRWTLWVHRTFPRPACHHPRTDRCGQHSAVPCGDGTRRRTIVRGRDARILHLQAVATDWPPNTRLDSGDRWRTVRAEVTTRHSTEGIRSVQLVGVVSISGM